MSRSLKLAGLVVATACGFAIGNHGNEAIAPTEPPPVIRIGTATTAAAQPNPNASLPPSKSVLRELKFEQRLATCELADFPALMDAELERAEPAERFLQMMKIWNTRDQAGLIDWLLARPDGIPVGPGGKNSFPLRENLVSILTPDDPVGAWAVAERLKARDSSKWFILQATLKSDPVKALELAEAHPQILVDARFRTGGGPVSGIHPMQMLPVINALHPGGGRNNFVNDASNYYATRPGEIDSAAEWFQQLPADAQRFLVNKLEYNKFSGEGTGLSLPKLREIWKLPAE